jgi:hypothetical protein
MAAADIFTVVQKQPNYTFIGASPNFIDIQPHAFVLLQKKLSLKDK